MQIKVCTRLILIKLHVLSIETFPKRNMVCANYVTHVNIEVQMLNSVVNAIHHSKIQL